MFAKVTVLSLMFALLVSGCDTTNTQPYLDGEFKPSSKAYTNVFELLKKYERQTDALGQAGGVRIVRYYENNGRYVGYTNKASSWFSLITEDEIKQRLIKRIKKKTSRQINLENIVGPVRIVDGIGFYLKDEQCYFISVLKRLVSSGWDNDSGAPDFVGYFHVCGGLQGTPEQFIERINVADNATEARFLQRGARDARLGSSDRQLQSAKNNSGWKTRSIIARWAGSTELINGEMHYQRSGLSGRLSLTFPNHLPEAIGRCSGTYTMTEPPSGRWSISCANGMSASGTMGADGNGLGQDDQGRSIKYVVSGR